MEYIKFMSIILKYSYTFSDMYSFVFSCVMICIIALELNFTIRNISRSQLQSN